MRSVLQMLVGVLALVFFLSHAHANQVTKQLTPNGHAYWHITIDGAKRTAVAINWKSGLAGLPEGKELAARLGIDLMLEGGAGGKQPDEIIADFQDLDAGSRLFIQPDQIRGFIVTSDDVAVEAGKIANMVLRNPNFEQRWLDRFKKKLTDEAQSRMKNIWGIAWTTSRRLTLSGHENERFWSLLPFENIHSIDMPLIKKWHSKAFATGNMQIVAAGTNNYSLISQAIDAALEGLPGGAANGVEKFDGLAIPAKTILFHAPEAEKSLVMAQGALPASAAGQDLKINIATGVLGYGQQSRLFKAIRDELRASYRFGSSMNDFTRNHRLLTIGGEVEEEKLADALNVMAKTYEEFRKEGIGFLEFPFARRFYGQRIEKEMKKPESVAYMLMESRLDGEPDNAIETLPDRIENLERGDVNSFIADTYPAFDQMLKIIVTPNAALVPGACVITSLDELSKC